MDNKDSDPHREGSSSSPGNVDEGTDNIFARLLMFYHDYRRDKINPTDLEKIVSKYSKKPSKVLPDLTKKYRLPIASRVGLFELSRLLALFNIPSSYASLLPLNGAHSFKYDESLDPRSQRFDASLVLRQRWIFLPKSNVQPLDNISKAKLLLPWIHCAEDRSTRVSNVEAVQISLSSQSEESVQSPSINEVDKIAHVALCQIDKSLELQEAIEISPFNFLYRCMQSKEKVQVIVRAHDSIRGRIYGTLEAFDKHFNLVLKNAHEEYILDEQYQKFTPKDSRDSDGSCNNLNVCSSSTSSSSACSNIAGNVIKNVGYTSEIEVPIALYSSGESTSSRDLLFVINSLGRESNVDIVTNEPLVIDIDGLHRPRKSSSNQIEIAEDKQKLVTKRKFEASHHHGSKYQQLRRFLPHVLLRGANVVLVCKYSEM